VFAGAFGLPRTHAGPGPQMTGGWEAAHIGADFIGGAALRGSKRTITHPLARSLRGFAGG